MNDEGRMIAVRDIYRDRYPEHADQWDDLDALWEVKTVSGLRVAVIPFIFTAAVAIGRPHTMTWYDDRWCYHGVEAAFAAAEAWNGPWPDTEPIGWHRHPATGRRRPGGDPAREVVAP